MTAFDFLRILRNVGSPVDVVLLVEAHDSMTEEDARANGFFTLLRKEYQTTQLCNIIIDVIANRYGINRQQQPSQVQQQQYGGDYTQQNYDPHNDQYSG